MKTQRGNGNAAILLLAVGGALLAGCGGGGGGGSSKIATPRITTQPTSKTADVGSPVTFSVKASGGSLSYQWHRIVDGADTALAGGTDSTFTLVSVATADAGSYYVSVSNAVGSATSDPTTLTVTASGGASVSID